MLIVFDRGDFIEINVAFQEGLMSRAERKRRREAAT
jgi:hypothetical protein